MLARFSQLCLVLWVWWFSAGLVNACPNCKDGLLENGQNGLNLAWGFELSIYLLLGAPLLIVTTLASVFYYQIKKAKRSGLYPDTAEVIARAEARVTS